MYFIYFDQHLFSQLHFSDCSFEINTSLSGFSCTVPCQSSSVGALGGSHFTLFAPNNNILITNLSNDWVHNALEPNYTELTSNCIGICNILFLFYYLFLFFLIFYSMISHSPSGIITFLLSVLFEIKSLSCAHQQMFSAPFKLFSICFVPYFSGVLSKRIDIVNSLFFFHLRFVLLRL